LLEREGFGVSTKRIADAAGIAEGTVFRVFSTKEELLRSALRSYLDPADVIAQIDAIDPAAPLADKVARVMTLLQEAGSRIHLFMMALRHRDQADPKGSRWDNVFRFAPPGCPERGDGEEEFSHHSQFAPQATVLRDRVVAVLNEDADQLTVDPQTAATFVVLASMTALMGMSAIPIDRDTLVHLILRAIAGSPEPVTTTTSSPAQRKESE
jgi:AcrR family transcriptional regulator